jgi:hypothetical protein
MKKETRKFTVEREGTDFFFCYKGKRCQLDLGLNDFYEVNRYGDDFFILSLNDLLGYAGFELISKDCEKLQDCFFQDIQVVFEEVKGTKKDFFKYTPSYQADFLAQWLQ